MHQNPASGIAADANRRVCLAAARVESISRDVPGAVRIHNWADATMVWMRADLARWQCPRDCWQSTLKQKKRLAPLFEE